MQNFTVTKSTLLKPMPDVKNLGFGKYFSDHMFQLNYATSKGWHNGRITPYQPLAIDPAATVLHYGQALFEGMKCFRQTQGDLVLFRPEYNAMRLQNGADRLCMEAPPVEIMIEGIRQLVRVDQAWVPKERGSSLYLRPTLIGMEAFLGVRPASEYLFFVICSPVSSYYSEGADPIKIWVEDTFIRAAPGGLGATKAGANYAASLKAALVAKEKGYAQVLWQNVTHQSIEEVGTMNVFFVFENEIVTPALNGSILPGGVRDCVLKLLKHMGLPVTERELSMDEVRAAYQKGTLKEVFGTGTAAVISPVGELSSNSYKMVINEGVRGPIATELYNHITGIQYGEKEDIFGWVQKV
ncbi:MAG: branched chain amino acid aminotransferase [Bdellovibrionales bacterium RIFCSPHIGHO2_01_FULL_40_29]|nr:MAG: branched chain amino acid aminotransferase [Bdellovibrionales bacterium RIFCSPHIGHO2_01_FULL_40_29]OFZ34570.1 MAG: branched chain amino acid aminotransferase [Bdellovibrionales bacterium RIFCSPHIGHO2_02_FULL_40_15]